MGVCAALSLRDADVRLVAVGRTPVATAGDDTLVNKLSEPVTGGVCGAAIINAGEFADGCIAHGRRKSENAFPRRTQELDALFDSVAWHACLSGGQDNGSVAVDMSAAPETCPRTSDQHCL